jgi:hypothetical protein
MNKIMAICIPKKLFLIVAVICCGVANAAETASSQANIDALKKWYERHYPQEDNEEAALWLEKALMECRLNKARKEESSKTCLAVKEHIADFMMDKRRLAEKIIFDFEGLKLDWLFRDSVEKDILFSFSDNDDKGLLVDSLVNAPIEELMTIVRDIVAS